MADGTTPITPRPPATPRPLPPTARAVDAALIRIDREIDWLMALSPLGNEAMWHAFAASGYRDEPELRYPPARADLGALHEELAALPVGAVEEPAIEALLREKQRELDRQIELVSLRGTPGFTAASIELFGEADPELLRVAQAILDTVAEEAPLEASAGIDDIVAAAEAEFARYRAADPAFDARIVVLDDLSGGLMVNHGDLYLARGVLMAPERIAPLVAHEVGTHVLTAHNGRRQPLRQLAAGLAGYDPLQEGLGTFSEYLAGYLPPGRLRVLAGRVVAADRAVRGEDVRTIFARLHEGEGISAEDAFDTAVRAKRGGALTKDAVYLRGLRNLLAYLSAGGQLEFLLLGKFAMKQRHTIQHLYAEGWLTGPALLPSYLEDEAAKRRLERARALRVDQLFQTSPEP